MSEVSEPVRDVLLVGRRRMELVTMLTANPQLRVAVITEPECLSYYPPVASVCLVDDVQDLDALRRAALGLMDRRPFDAVIGPAESSIPSAGYLRSYFGLPGIPFDVAQACCNKAAMKARLRRAGLPVADSALVSTGDSLGRILRSYPRPSVVKPVGSDGCAHVYIVDDVETVERLSDRSGPMRTGVAPPYLVEQYLDVSEEYHCDGLVRGAGVEFVAVSKYLEPPLRHVGRVFGSHTLPADSAEARYLSDLHERVVAAVGLTDGVTHLEVLRSGNDFVVGEIACRPGGGGIATNLRHGYGFDSWRHFLACELNVSSPWTPRAADGVYLNVGFPAGAGVVRQVPSEADFVDVPEVRLIQVTARVGERRHGPQYSTSSDGLIYCHLADVDDVSRVVQDLEDRFVVDYERGSE